MRVCYPFVYNAETPYIILFYSDAKRGYEDLSGGVDFKELIQHSYPEVLQVTAMREARKKSCSTIRPEMDELESYLDCTDLYNKVTYPTFLYKIRKREFSRDAYYWARDKCIDDPDTTEYWKETDDVE